MLKKLVREKPRPMNIKILPSERASFQKKADLYTGGNMSELVREAVRVYCPKDEELTK